MSDLQRLNELRAQLGIDPLKSWKASKAELSTAIDKIAAKVASTRTAQRMAPVLVNTGPNAFKVELKDTHVKPAVVIPANIKVKQCPPPAALVSEQKRRDMIEAVALKRMNGANITKLPDPASVGQPMKEKLAPIKAQGDTISLADIARELKISPKVARNKMRRLSPPAEAIAGKHLFKTAYKQLIIDILKKDHRK